MAKFANDKKIDLGELGKFKRSFLEEAILLCPSPVEHAYKTRLKKIKDEIAEIGATKIGLFCNIQKIYQKTKRYKDLIERQNKLNNDMSNYFEEFPDRRYKYG